MECYGTHSYNYSNEEDSLSTSSSTTVTYQETALTSPAAKVNEVEDSTQSTPSSLNDYTETTLQHSSTSTSTLDKDQGMEKANYRPRRVFSRRLSNASTSTMTKVRESPETCSKSDPVQYFKVFIVLIVHVSTFAHNEQRKLISKSTLKL